MSEAGVDGMGVWPTEARFFLLARCVLVLSLTRFCFPVLMG